MAQLVERRTPDLGSGHDLAVCELEPRVGLCADSVEPVWDSLSPSLCPSLARARSLSLSLSLSQKSINIKKIERGAPGWLSRLSL